MLRMNKCIEKEFGEHIVEKRSWHWALTGFGMDVWEERLIILMWKLSTDRQFLEP